MPSVPARRARAYESGTQTTLEARRKAFARAQEEGLPLRRDSGLHRRMEFARGTYPVAKEGGRRRHGQ
jgi:hypothetical protein